MFEKDFPCLTPPQVEECEVVLFIGNERIQTFLCTPEALEELAVGHLYCRGIIKSGKEISQIEVSDKTGETISIRVRLNTEASPDSEILPALRLPDLTRLKSLADRIKNMAGKYRTHGGVHCAALSDGQEIVCLYEDVGRHNAFDKAVGAAVLNGHSPDRLIYFSSGRINSEIAEKAAVCRLPLLVSRSIATTRACAIVSQWETFIIGRIESQVPILYTDPSRGVE